MHNSSVPKTIQRWIAKNPEKYQGHFMEEDEWGLTDGFGPWSIWLDLKCPFYLRNYVQTTIHAASVTEFKELVGCIVTAAGDEIADVERTSGGW